MLQMAERCGLSSGRSVVGTALIVDTGHLEGNTGIRAPAARKD